MTEFSAIKKYLNDEFDLSEVMIHFGKPFYNNFSSERKKQKSVRSI